MKINWLDCIGSTSLIISLFLIPLHRLWWLLYATACFIWIIIHFTKKLYFGMIMNLIAMTIGIINFYRGG